MHPGSYVRCMCCAYFRGAHVPCQLPPHPVCYLGSTLPPLLTSTASFPQLSLEKDGKDCDKDKAQQCCEDGKA